MSEFSQSTQDQLSLMKHGCVIFTLSGPSSISERDLTVATWKTQYTVNLMISKVDQKSLKNKLRVETSTSNAAVEDEEDVNMEAV